MAISRDNLYDENSSPAPTGTEYLTQRGDVLDALLDTGFYRLTGVGGTANVITASAEPVTVPATGLVAGMKFSFEPTATNTSTTTINIDSRGAKAILRMDGSVLQAGDLLVGVRYTIEYDGSDFMLLNSTSTLGGGGTLRTVYDTTAVWANTLAANTIIMVECWGAGGGGGVDGGGGGAYKRGFFTAGDLPANVTITVPGTSAASTDGGNCSFGSYMVAHGGGAGSGVAGLGAGVGPNGTVASGVWGGGNGSGDPLTDGSDACYGGGGGGQSSSSGGQSDFGGNGGDGGNPGARPGGGGGGGNQTGGAGRCIITVLGG